MHNQNDFTIDPVKFHGLDALVDDIKKAGMHYVMILDPGVSASEPKGTYPPYDDGIAQDIFIKNEDGSVFVGKVWNPNSTVFPDFTNPKVDKYWTKQIRKLHELIPFDGLWIVSYHYIFCKVLFPHNKFSMVLPLRTQSVPFG